MSVIILNNDSLIAVKNTVKKDSEKLSHPLMTRPGNHLLEQYTLD